ncbi:MAG TPA: FecR domain-containing protein, partial [Rhizomicrobium sp.]
MSEADQENSIMPDAKEIRARASDWVVERRVPENWSEDTQAEFDAWLSESPAHLVAYLRLDAAWNRTERLAALRTDAGEIAEGEKKSRPALRWRVMSVLALIAVAAAASAIFLLGSNEKTYSTQVGGHQMVTLADGSQIELNTNTTIRVAEGANGRIVTLDSGEAYFQVRHDAAHPFVVMAGDHRLLDLGTKFLVRNDADRLEVALMEGRVRLQQAEAASRAVMLTPGDVAVATTKSIAVTRNTAQVQIELSWRRGMLIFKHTSLASAAAEFNRYNRQKLIVADAASARLTINGTFRTIDVDAFVDVAQDILHLRVERLGDETIISR